MIILCRLIFFLFINQENTVLLDYSVLLTGLLIMAARILDVSMGTVRTIVTVQGRILLAFVLGFFEVIIWVAVASTVITSVKDSPVLVVFFALGFALGNVVGILVEQQIALGPVSLKMITTEDRKDKIVNLARELYLDITMISGMGTRGPVSEIFTVCRRKDLKQILPSFRKLDPNIFYITEPVKDVSRSLRPLINPSSRWQGPICNPATGWRAVLKKK